MKKIKSLFTQVKSTIAGFISNKKEKAHTLALQVSVLLTVPLVSSSANASALGKLTTMLTTWKDEFYALLGIVSFLYVMWYAIQAKMERKQWSEVGVAVFQVAIVGGISVAVPFAWTFFA